jgi:hypothetical protein
LTISDCARGPWGKGTASRETTRFPAHPVQAQLFAGNPAALTVPDRALWRHPAGAAAAIAAELDRPEAGTS